MRVVIIGAGGHAKVIADIIHADAGLELKGFTDPSAAKQGMTFMGYPVLGGDDMVEKLLQAGPLGAILGTGDIGLRRKLLAVFGDSNITWINAIHRNSCIAQESVMGQGIAVMAGAVINCDTTIGDHTIVNTNSSIDHDCVIGENVHIAPGVAIGGSCSIGSDTMIGIGSRIIPGTMVGANCIVGAGSVVLENVPERTLVGGVPARTIKKLPR